jgi:hypothetical protein
MSTVKSKNLQVGTDATASNNFTIYQPSTPDGTLRVGVGNADSPTEVGRFTNAGYKPANAPFFYASASADQTPISAATWTKVVLDTEVYDTANCFDNSSTYRFTPNVAGYYLFNHSVRVNFTTSMSQANVVVWKNGGSSEKGQMNLVRNQNAAFHVAGSCIHYLNGTTDYVELYVYINGTGTLSLNYGASNAMTWWEGILLQQA